MKCNNLNSLIDTLYLQEVKREKKEKKTYITKMINQWNVYI
jgi:hypothetical protein